MNQTDVGYKIKIKDVHNLSSKELLTKLSGLKHMDTIIEDLDICDQLNLPEDQNVKLRHFMETLMKLSNICLQIIYQEHIIKVKNNIDIQYIYDESSNIFKRSISCIYTIHNNPSVGNHLDEIFETIDLFSHFTYKMYSILENLTFIDLNNLTNYHWLDFYIGDILNKLNSNNYNVNDIINQEFNVTFSIKDDYKSLFKYIFIELFHGKSLDLTNIDVSIINRYRCHLILSHLLFSRSNLTVRMVFKSYSFFKGDPYLIALNKNYFILEEYLKMIKVIELHMKDL
jgi:hypothetical protein